MSSTNNTTKTCVCKTFSCDDQYNSLLYRLTMQTLGERIRSAANKKGMSLKRLSTELGVTYETVRKWATNETAPNRSRMLDVCRILEIRESELRFGEQEVIETQLSVQEPRARYGTSGSIAVPVFDARASMGKGYLAPDNDVIVGGLTLDENWIRSHLGAVSNPKNLAVIPAYGDSMTPTFADGDLLLVDKGVADIRLDAIYVLGLNGELFVKRLQRRPNQTILMISDNKAYEPYAIENGERSQFSVLGRVVWAWNGRKL
jgi:phage repressor protein C with HTH and peptisase S24 domain